MCPEVELEKILAQRRELRRYCRSPWFARDILILGQLWAYMNDLSRKGTYQDQRHGYECPTPLAVLGQPLPNLDIL